MPVHENFDGNAPTGKTHPIKMGLAPPTKILVAMETEERSARSSPAMT